MHYNIKDTVAIQQSRKIEGSFTSRNVVDGDWKFRNLKQKFRNLHRKLQKYINIFDIFVEYFRIFTSLYHVRYSWLDSVGQSIVNHKFGACAFRYCSKPLYNAYACALQYGLFRFIHNACSCEGNCLVGLIIPAYSVGFSVASLYTRPAHATLQVARCNFQLQNICQQCSLNLALHLIRH